MLLYMAHGYFFFFEYNDHTNKDVVCRIDISLKQNQFWCLETSFRLGPSQAFSSLRKC